MTKFFTASKQILGFLLIIEFASRIELSKARSVNKLFNNDMSLPGENEVRQQRRMNYLQQLRNLLLTLYAEERAAKRERQNFYKRRLVRKILLE